MTRRSTRRGRSTCVLIGCAVAVLPGWFASAAAAASASPVLSAVATSATHAVGTPSTSQPCTATGVASGSVLQVSDDRGATWQAGPCVPGPASGALSVDPTDATVVYNTASQVVWLDATGAVVAQAAEPADGPGVVLASKGYAFGLVHQQTVRIGRDGSEVACAAPGSATLVVLGDGSLLGRSVQSGQAGQWSISRDSCQSFTPVPALGGCDLFVQPIGPHAVVCGASSGARSGYDVDAGTSFPLPYFEGTGEPPWVLVGSSMLHIDALTTLGDPATYPAAVPFHFGAVPGDPVPAGPLTNAMDVVDSVWRAPLGLPPMSWSAGAAQAAYNHAHEWELAGVLPGLGAHSETPGAPGFTGSSPPARCAAIPVVGCGEDAAPGTPDPVQAVSIWLAAPYHAEDFLTQGQVGLGATAAGSVADFPANAGGGFGWYRAPLGSLFNLALPVNTPDSQLHVWPPDGATDVPPAWTVGEVPDPLENYAGARSVGSPIYLFGLAPASLELLDSSGGAIPLLAAGASTAATIVSNAGSTFSAAFPTTALTPGATYTLAVTPVFGAPQTLHFTVAKSDASPNHPTVSRCTVSIRQLRAGHMTRVRFTRKRSACASTSLQWHPRGSGRWRTMSAKGIVAPHGHLLFWRVRRARQTLASGHVRVALRRR